MRSWRVFTLLSGGLLVAFACSSYSGTEPREAADASPPIETTSSSGAAPSSSSSSSSSGAPDAEAPPTRDAGSCTSFTLSSPMLACAAPGVLCLGTAALGSSGVFLTVSSTRSEPAIGLYWHALGLSRSAAFTLTAQLEILQGSNGGPPGHGFAMTWVQRDSSNTTGFPPLGAGGVNTLGIHRLEGFSGAAAFVRTYEAGARGLLGLRATRIPSSSDSQVDDWLGASPDVATFAPTDRVHLRVILVNRPDAQPIVELLRGADDTFSMSTSLGTIALPLREEHRYLDYLGISAARGDDTLSQSGHRLRSLSLSCDE